MSRVNHRVGEDVQLRLQNLHLAANYVHHFYYTVLKQLIITALPDVVVIAHSPSSGELPWLPWRCRIRLIYQQHDRRQLGVVLVQTCCGLFDVASLICYQSQEIQKLFYYSLSLSPDKALEELEKMMVLLLGCAVQCENKAALIHDGHDTRHAVQVRSLRGERDRVGECVNE